MFFCEKGIRTIFCFLCMVTLGDKITPNLCFKFSCEICDYNTNKKSSYENHIMSWKHQNSQKGLQMGQNYAQNMPTNICSCGKQYQHRQGLWRHKKLCQTNNVQKNVQNSDDTKNQQLVEYLLKENSELKTLVITTLQEQNKNIVELAKEVKQHCSLS